MTLENRHSPHFFLPRDLSVLCNQPDVLRRSQISAQTVVNVYTDGPGKKVTGVLRAGYAVHFPHAPHLGTLHPLRGATQTVQRAELRAACCTIENAPSRLRIISDSSYVVSGIAKLLSGNPHVFVNIKIFGSFYAPALL